MSILFFVEDPGAVNFLSEVPQEIEKIGITSKLLASSYATEILNKRGVSFKEINKETLMNSIFEGSDVKLLITGTSQNSNSIGLDLIDYAKEKGIVTASFVDSSADYDLRFKGKSNSPLNHSPEWLIVPDKYSKELYIKLGFPMTNIVISGNPNYENIASIKKRLDKKGLKHLKGNKLKGEITKPVVVFIDEHSNEGDPRLFKSEEYNFYGREGSSNRNEVILGEVLDIFSKLNKETHLIVRLHPKSNKSDYLSVISEIDEFSSDNDPYELVYGADLVIGMTSILLMESFLLGKKVISAIPREYEMEWAPPNLLDTIDCVHNPKDLEKAIKKAFSDETENEAPNLFLEGSPKENIRNFIIKILSNF